MYSALGAEEFSRRDTFATRNEHKTIKRTKDMIKNPSPIDRICPAPLLPVGAPAPRAPPSRRNVAVVSHDQYVLTVTAAPASRVKTELSKAAW